MGCVDHTHSRRVCWSLLAALACGGMLAFGSVSADAACGDWLVGHVADDATDPIAKSDVAPHHAAAAERFGAFSFRDPLFHATTPEAEKSRRGGRLPCSGPACSRLPDLPLAPAGPPEPVTPTSRLQAVVAHTDLLPVSAAAWLVVNDSLFCLDGPTSRIERPPMRG